MKKCDPVHCTKAGIEGVIGIETEIISWESQRNFSNRSLVDNIVLRVYQQAVVKYIISITHYFIYSYYLLEYVMEHLSIPL